MKRPVPSTPLSGSLVYDAARQRIVAVSRPLVGLADTWTWDGLGWSVVSAQSAPSVIMAAMAYDSLRQRVVRFGGRLADPSAPPGFLDDTWEWDQCR